MSSSSTATKRPTKKQQILSILRDASGQQVTVQAMADIIGAKSSSLHNALSDLAQAKQIERVKSGVYVGLGASDVVDITDDALSAMKDDPLSPEEAAALEERFAQQLANAAEDEARRGQSPSKPAAVVAPATTASKMPEFVGVGLSQPDGSVLMNDVDGSLWRAVRVSLIER